MTDERNRSANYASDNLSEQQLVFAGAVGTALANLWKVDRQDREYQPETRRRDQPETVGNLTTTQLAGPRQS